MLCRFASLANAGESTESSGTPATSTLEPISCQVLVFNFFFFPRNRNPRRLPSSACILVIILINFRFQVLTSPYRRLWPSKHNFHAPGSSMGEQDRAVGDCSILMKCIACSLLLLIESSYDFSTKCCYKVFRLLILTLSCPLGLRTERYYQFEIQSGYFPAKTFVQYCGLYERTDCSIFRTPTWQDILLGLGKWNWCAFVATVFGNFWICCNWCIRNIFMILVL